MKLWQFGAWTLTCALLTGCGGSATTKPDDKPEEKTKPAGDSKPLPSGKAIVKGKVTFDGTMPDLEKLTAEGVVAKVTQDKDHCLVPKAGADKEQQEWRINPTNKGLANVVVFLLPDQGFYFTNDATDEAISKKKGRVLELRQPDCAFKPHVDVLFPEYQDKDKKTQTFKRKK